jgi:hypothetical protein
LVADDRLWPTARSPSARRGSVRRRRSAFVLFIPYDVLVQAGDLVAYDENGQVLGRQYADFTALHLSSYVIEQSPPDAIEALEAVQLAGAVAQRYFYEHNSWARFDPAAASAISDAVAYNTSSTAVVGEVSLRVADKNSIVLATKTPSGDVYSACFEDGPTFATQGRNDTSDPSACPTGGSTRLDQRLLKVTADRRSGPPRAISNSAKPRVSGCPQNSPIRSARSSSGSRRTWSSLSVTF